MMHRIARRCPTPPSPATSSSASAARPRTSFREVGATWSSGRGSRTASSSSTARELGTKADDPPDRRRARGLVKKRRNNELLAVQDGHLRGGQPTLRRPDGRGAGGGAEQVGPSRLEAEPPAEFGQLTGRTTCDRIVVFDGNPRPADRPRPAGRDRVGPARSRSSARATLDWSDSPRGGGRSDGSRMASRLRGP